MLSREEALRLALLELPQWHARRAAVYAESSLAFAALGLLAASGGAVVGRESIWCLPLLLIGTSLATGALWYWHCADRAAADARGARHDSPR